MHFMFIQREKTVYVILILCVLLSQSVHAQHARRPAKKEKGSKVEKVLPAGGAGDSSRMVLVPTIEAMQQLADSATLVIVTDSLRGGTFFYSADTLVDGGTIFRSAVPGAGSWKRQYEKTNGINVRWFGALGDGHTNDAPALQQAINKAASLLVPALLPDGIYFVASNTTLYLPANAYLKGQDKESTRIITDAAFVPEAPMLLKSYGDHIHIENIGFDGGRHAGARSALQAGRYSILNMNFDAETAHDILIEHCSFSNSYGRALLYRASHFRIDDCDFSHIGRYNINFSALDGAISNFAREGCMDVTIANSRFTDIGTHCLSSYKINGLYLLDNKLQQISGIGMANQECERVKVTGNAIFNTGDNGMDFQRCKQVLISDNYFVNAGDNNAGRIGSGAAIFFGDDYSTANASNTVISNNFIRGTFSYDHSDTTKSYQNCGLYIIDANHVKISDNNIQGIGEPNTDLKKQPTLEDGNGIMLINTAKGESHDILVQGNTLTNLKCDAIYINGQSREIKVKDNYINTFGIHGIYMCAVGTNLYSQIEGNTIIDGKNIFRKEVAADIFIKAENAWITNFSITNNQMRNNKRVNYQTRNDTVYTTHGIYFTAEGFGKFNNLIVSNNQIHGHVKDEIGFSDKISEYSILKDTYFPAVSFNNNYSGSTDDYPRVIIPGLNQSRKPRIVTESFGEHEPDYGNYTAGSIIRNIYPGNGVYAWVATNSGFAALTRWRSQTVYTEGQTVYEESDVFLCTKGGVSGRNSLKAAADKPVSDGSAEWKYMGKKVYFKELHLR